MCTCMNLTWIYVCVLYTVQRTMMINGISDWIQLTSHSCQMDSISLSLSQNMFFHLFVIECHFIYSMIKKQPVQVVHVHYSALVCRVHCEESKNSKMCCAMHTKYANTHVGRIMLHNSYSIVWILMISFHMEITKMWNMMQRKMDFLDEKSVIKYDLFW